MELSLKPSECHHQDLYILSSWVRINILDILERAYRAWKLQWMLLQEAAETKGLPKVILVGGRATDGQCVSYRVVQGILSIWELSVLMML